MAKNNKYDLLALGVKSTVAAIPYIGPVISETICQLIPHQRIDRIESMLISLSKKLEEFEIEKLKDRLDDPLRVDLLEEGVIQSARALSDERIDNISSLVKNSLSEEQISHNNQMRFFSVLKELSDVEIIMLMYSDICNQGGKRNEFYLKHKSILQHPPRENRKELAFYQSNKDHLLRLKLCRQTYDLINTPEPEFDHTTGKIKGTGFKITDFGRMFLESIDKAHPPHPNYDL